MFDAIVIGGGPAGSSFAYGAAQEGKKILVLEKDPVPSPKVCGGVLSPRCMRAFEKMGLREVVMSIPAQEVEHLEVELSSGEHVDISFPTNSEGSRVVDRVALDEALWNAAAKAGATMRDRSAVNRVHFSEDHWEVETQGGEKFSGAFLVGADGRNSFVARQLGLKANGGGRSLCFQYRLKKHEFCRKGVHFFIFPNGYCGLSVDGTGLAHLDVISLQGGENESVLQQRLRSQRARFVEKMERAEFVPSRPVTRSPIGSGWRSKPSHSKVILLGDAQAWVEPFTGEGISLAVESASKGAELLWSSNRIHHVRPKASFTNHLVAQALKKPMVARGLVNLIRMTPRLGKWMSKDVLR
jgi:menaquinone-9 beta-reductase